MRSICLIILLFTVCGAAKAQKTPATMKMVADTIKKVEAACGECKLGMKGEGCNLAVRFDGKSYFVDGSKIDDHGDAHADDGFCNKIRKARVSGTVVNDRFVATSFKLLPEEKAKQ